MLLVAKWARCKSESLAKVDAFVKVHATSPAFSFDFGGRVRNKAPRASKVACCSGRAWCSKKDESVPRPPFSRTRVAVAEDRGEFAITASARNAEQRVASRSSCSTKSETAPLSNSESMTSANRAVTSPTHSMARSLISRSTAPATSRGRAASSNFDATSMPSPSAMSASMGLTNSATATHSRNPSSINLYHSALTASIALGTASSTIHFASSPRARALLKSLAPSNFRDCDFSARPRPEASATSRTSSSPKAPGGALTHNSRSKPKQADFVLRLSPTLPEMGFLHARQACGANAARASVCAIVFTNLVSVSTTSTRTFSSRSLNRPTNAVARSTSDDLGLASATAPQTRTAALLTFQDVSSSSSSSP
mmetsp:Transcript_10633/g.31350  ORF Transcript_10633/g.31350 Transcript_10633/m.31350 type:complete len:368 (+) Transcript_10633:1187-2290(+)